MPAHARLLFVLACLSALGAVLIGAFGAHALRGRLGADLLAVYETGVQYHFWHALGMLLLALAAAQWPAARGLVWAGLLMFAGILLFSGSLYLLAMSGQRWLGAITPLGGLAFVIAWGIAAWTVWRTA